MHVYTFLEAKQNFSVLFEQAQSEGGVQIKGDNGKTFVLSPIIETKSPLDVEGVSLGLSADEIVSFVHEGRKNG